MTSAGHGHLHNQAGDATSSEVKLRLFNNIIKTALWDERANHRERYNALMGTVIRVDWVASRSLHIRL